MPKTASIGFSTDAFHAGQDSYSPVSLVYFDRAPFKFTGKITTFYVKYQCPDLSMTFNAAEIGGKGGRVRLGVRLSVGPLFPPPSPISLPFPYAESADAATISGYFGKGDSFGQALGEFSPAHADHTEQNHAALVRRYAPGDWRL